MPKQVPLERQTSSRAFLDVQSVFRTSVYVEGVAYTKLTNRHAYGFLNSK